MTNVLAELPANTFSLARAEAPGIVEEVGEKFGISVVAREFCTHALLRLFDEYGGFKEQPYLPQRIWRPYHNGSHEASVMAIGTMLAHKGGEPQERIDAVAVGAVYHDWHHHFTGFGENEKQSWIAARADLVGTPLARLESAVGDTIMGTVVLSVGAEGIKQAAAESNDELPKYLADADLCSLVAPNSAALALRLQVEHEVTPRFDQVRHNDVVAFYADTAHQHMYEFLSNTMRIQRGHHYLSRPGQELLQPLLAERATELEHLRDTKDPIDFFRAA